MDRALEKELREIYNGYINRTGKVARPVQEALTVDIARRLFSKGVLFAESRTGTGKTLAYLLAAAFYIKHAPDSRAKRVTITTPQKHLQQEIMKGFKTMVEQIPEFQGITIANVKGRRNYVSKAKVMLLDESLEKAHIAIDKSDLPVAGKDRQKAELAGAVEEIKASIERCAGDLDLIENEIDDKFLEDRLLEKGVTLRDLLALSDEIPARTSKGKESKPGKTGKKGKGNVPVLTDEPDPAEVYYLAAKTNASLQADIVVTNHTLLLISGRLAVLNKNNPNAQNTLVPMENLIIDEAHALVRAARDVWHEHVSINHIIDYLMRLSIATEQAQAQGAYSTAGADAVTVDRLRRSLVQIRDNFRSKIRSALSNTGTGEDIRLDIPTIFTQDITDSRYGIREFIRNVEDCLYLATKEFTTASDRKQKKHTPEQKSCLKELQRHAGIVKNFNKVFDTAATSGTGGYGYYVSFSPVHNEPVVGRLPLYISSYLRTALWENIETAVLLSGTIADKNSYNASATSIFTKPGGNYLPNAQFETIKILLGLGDKSKVARKISVAGYSYRPPFAWTDVAVHLYDPAIIPPFCKPGKPGEVVADNLPDNPLDDPVDDEFDSEARTKLKREIAVAAAGWIDTVLHGYSARKRGGAMVLMPAYEDLEYLREELEKLFDLRRQAGLPVRDILAQERGGYTLNALVKQFRANENGKTAENRILITVGGWEGVDLPGDLLTHLFIVRVPHASPDDPVFRLAGSPSSRSAMFVRTKTEEFWRFRQGLGRLLRHEGDTGEIHIFDSRLLKDTDSTHRTYRDFINGEFPNKVQFHRELEKAANE